VTETPEAKAARLKARNRRNLIMAVSLVAFIALLFLVTMVRLQANIAERVL
jgi:hypothetical protein